MKAKRTSKQEPFPRRGSIYWAVLDPTVGREIQKTRPVLIVSNNEFNDVTDMVVVIPITSGRYSYRHWVEVLEAKSGLSKPSSIVPEQIRSIDQRRLRGKVGEVNIYTMRNAEQVIRDLLGLPESGMLP